MKARKINKEEKGKTEKPLDIGVFDQNGRKVDTITLNGKIFDGVVNAPLIHQVATMYMANKRAGCASTKTRSEVRGGGKKPWRQKGTGRARTGSIRNPLWRGGGIIFGPHPRDFSYTLPQKIRKSAIRSVLNDKFLADKITIVKEIKLAKPKTKDFLSVMKSLGVKEREKVIFVFEKVDDNIKLASRNIPNALVAPASVLNALDIIRHDRLVIQEAALKTLLKKIKDE